METMKIPLKTQHQTPKHYENERPTAYADRLGQWYAASVSQRHKKSLGQYLTPVEIAMFMARLCQPGEGIDCQREVCQ